MAVTRITQNATNRMYGRNFNRNLNAMTDMMNKISAQRKFVRASENPISAARALAVRKNMVRTDTQQANLNSAEGILNVAESTLREEVNDEVKDIITRIETAINTTYSQEELNIMGVELRTIADGLIKSMNIDYGDRQLFGGTNNSELAFTTSLDADGRTIVNYNGVNVNSYDVPWDFPSSDPIFTDVGYGIEYDDDGNIVPDSAMDLSLNGAELLGCGMGDFQNENGDQYRLSNNVIQLVYDAAVACEQGDRDKLNAMLDGFNSAHSNLLKGITNIGIKQSSIEYAKTRLDEYEYNLSAAQLELEGMSEQDLAEAITEYSSVEAAYSAVLQMGTSVIPSSIWDFM